MTVRLHLRAMRVLDVVEDLPERLVVAVVAISGVVRCAACGFKTAKVHATRKVKVADLCRCTTGCVAPRTARHVVRRTA